MTGAPAVGIRRTTIGCVGLLALIAGTVSYLHMHALVLLHSQPGWVTPLSVHGMIIAASTTLLAESRSRGRGGAISMGIAGGRITNKSLRALMTGLTHAPYSPGRPPTTFAGSA